MQFRNNKRGSPKKRSKETSLMSKVVVANRLDVRYTNMAEKNQKIYYIYIYIHSRPELNLLSTSEIGIEQPNAHV